MSFEQVKKKFCKINNIPLETKSFTGFNRYIDMKAFYHFTKNGLESKQLLKIQELRNFIEITDDKFAICNKLDKLFPNLTDIDGFDGK